MTATKRLFRLLAILPLTFAAALPAVAQQQTDEEEERPPFNGTLYSQPRSVSVSLQLDIYEYPTDVADYDAGAGSEMRWVSNQVTVSLPNASGDWQRVNDARSSIALAYNWGQGIRWSTYFYEKDDFVPDLEPRTILGYAEAIIAGLPNNATVTFHTEESEWAAGMSLFRPFNAPIVLVHYTVVTDEGQASFEFYDYLSDLGDTIVLTRFSGPTGRLGQSHSNFLNYFRTTYILGEEDDGPLGQP